MEPQHTYFFDQAQSTAQRDPRVSFICMAARFGDVETLTDLLQLAQKDDQDFLTSPTAGLAFKRATQAGQVNVLKCLLRAGINVNTTFKGATALHEAVKMNNVDMLEFLLDVPGVDLNSFSTAQKTPVMEAACRGRLRCLSVLLGRGCGVNRRNGRGRTAAHYCMLPSIGTLDPDDMTSCLDLIYERGADIDAADNCGSTPLHVAIATENLEGVLWLLRHNCRLDLTANPQPLSPGVFSCIHRRVGLTPLMMAIHFSNRRLVQLLVGCGASYHGLGWTLQYVVGYELLHQFLVRCLSAPRSLQSLCRSRVRQSLGHDVEEKVKRLSCLPSSVQRYLLLVDELKDV